MIITGALYAVGGLSVTLLVSTGVEKLLVRSGRTDLADTMRKLATAGGKSYIAWSIAKLVWLIYNFHV